MSDDKRDSDGNPKKRPSWRDMLGRSSRYSKTLESSKRAARGVESGNERDDKATPSSDREGKRDGRQAARARELGTEAPGGIDEDEDITDVIEFDLAEVRRKIDELCKKDTEDGKKED